MWIHLALFIACLLLLGLASAAQSAFGYLNAARLRQLMQQGATRSQAMFEVSHHPGAFLSSVALFYMLAVAAATIVSVDFVQRTLEEPGQRIGTAVAAIVLMLAAQTIARGIAM